MLGAKFYHHIWSGGPLTHPAYDGGGRVCLWAQPRTQKPREELELKLDKEMIYPNSLNYH